MSDGKFLETLAGTSGASPSARQSSAYVDLLQRNSNEMAIASTGKSFCEHSFL